MTRSGTAWVMTALLLGVTSACSTDVGTGTHPTAVPAASPTSRNLASPAAGPEEVDAVTHASGRRYWTSASGPDTLVQAGAVTGRAPTASLRLAGRWTLPRVVSGGPAEGLAPGGDMLALAETPSEERSRFALVRTDLAEQPRLVTLPGGFTFDAWSPRADTLYLIQHLPPAGAGHYVVRAYDVASGRLLPEPIADKRTLGEQMNGLPESRATTTDGATVATLYLPHPGTHPHHGPFVHLLFTRDRTALCVDLPQPVARGWSLARAGGTFEVRDPSGRARYWIDAESGAFGDAG